MLLVPGLRYHSHDSTSFTTAETCGDCEEGVVEDKHGGGGGGGGVDQGEGGAGGQEAAGGHEAGDGQEAAGGLEAVCAAAGGP